MEESRKQVLREIRAGIIKERLHFVGVLVLCAAVIFGMVYCSASQESKAYNRLTGAATTTWDAMWIKLEVKKEPIIKK